MKRPNILIATEANDRHATIVGRRLTERGIPHARLDADTLISGGHAWRISSEHDTPMGGWGDIHPDVVWYRRKTPLLHHLGATEAFTALESEALFDAILEQSASARWVNPRKSLFRARQKLDQLVQARRCGLRIPETIVTDDPETLSTFALEHEHGIVAKPLSAQVLHDGDTALVIGTRRLFPEHYRAATRGTPCFAQERLAVAFEVRVLFFGDDVYAFRLTRSRPVDDLKQLRLEEIHHESYVLDPEIKYRLGLLMAWYGLVFSAVDLVMTEDGVMYFLELNPNGQWLWLQYMTGVDLLDPFIDLLCASS